MNLVKALQQGPGGGLNLWEGHSRDRRWAADPAQPRILNRGSTARDCAGPPEGEWVFDRVPAAGRA